MSRLVGAHVSASGGCFHAVTNAAKELGPQARAFAVFIRPRLTWRSIPPFSSTEVAQFQSALAQSQFDLANVVVHGSYLINFGSHDVELRRKSVELMVEEVLKCEQLGIGLYVFHPGSSTGHAHTVSKKTKPGKRKQRADPSPQPKRKTRRADANGETSVCDGDETQEVESADTARAAARLESLQFIATSLVEVLNRSRSTTLVLENMSGQGNVIGRDFTELRQILDAVVATSPTQAASRLGVCLDTCHAFAGGYAMDSARACDTMLEAFEAAMGSMWLARDVLKVIHVNDSKDSVGSRRDRHANIGRGTIGMQAFQWLMANQRFCDLPMILETPRHAKKSKKKAEIMESDSNQARESESDQTLSAQHEIAVLLRMVT